MLHYLRTTRPYDPHGNISQLLYRQKCLWPLSIELSRTLPFTLYLVRIAWVHKSCSKWKILHTQVHVYKPKIFRGRGKYDSILLAKKGNFNIHGQASRKKRCTCPCFQERIGLAQCMISIKNFNLEIFSYNNNNMVSKC